MREAFRIRSDKDTHFTTAIAANGGIEEEDIIFPNRAKKCAVVHAAIQADEALNWELWLASRAMKQLTDLDGDSVLGKIALDLATNGKRYAAGAQYYYDTALATPLPYVEESAALLDLDMDTLRSGKLKNFADESGVTDGTMTDCTTVEGRVGNAQSFNGTTSYVACGTNDKFRIDVGTLSAWVKISTTNQACIISRIRPDSPWTGYVLHMNDTGNVGKLAFYDGSVSVYGTKVINDGKWHHVAVTFSGTILRFYVDGALDIQRTITGVSSLSGQPLEVGRSGNASDRRYFTGIIDEPRVFPVALDDSSIEVLARNQRLSLMHMALVNRSVTPKTIGANGEVVVMLTMEPYG